MTSRRSETFLSNNFSRWIVFATMIWFAISCQESRNAVSKKVGNYVFEIRYQESLVEGVDEFVLTTSLAKKKEDFIEFLCAERFTKQDILYYLSYTMQKDVFIETSSGRIPCSIYHFERSYDLKPSRNINLGFEGITDEEFLLVIDSDLLGTGPVKFKFKKSNV